MFVLEDHLHQQNHCKKSVQNPPGPSSTFWKFGSEGFPDDGSLLICCMTRDPRTNQQSFIALFSYARLVLVVFLSHEQTQQKNEKNTQ